MDTVNFKLLRGRIPYGFIPQNQSYFPPSCSNQPSTFQTSLYLMPNVQNNAAQMPMVQHTSLYTPATTENKKQKSIQNQNNGIFCARSVSRKVTLHYDAGIGSVLPVKQMTVLNLSLQSKCFKQILVTGFLILAHLHA